MPRTLTNPTDKPASTSALETLSALCGASHNRTYLSPESDHAKVELLACMEIKNRRQEKVPTLDIF